MVDRSIGHIISYEFSDVLSYKQDSVKQTLDFLDAFTEEGLGKQSSYWVKGKDTEKLVGIKGGLIAVVNTADFFNKSGKVKKVFYEGGWLSRNVVFTFDESREITDRSIG